MFAELHAALDQAQKEVLRVAKARWDKRAKEMQASIEDRQRTATLLQQVLDMCNSPVSSVATLPAPSLPDLLTSASKTVQGLTRAPPTAPVPTTIEIKTNKDAILRMIPLVAWASDDVIPPRCAPVCRGNPCIGHVVWCN